MGILGEPWAPSGDPKVFVAKDGREMTVAVYTNGLLISDEGGATQAAHVEETAEPGVIKVAGQKFRAIPE